MGINGPIICKKPGYIMLNSGDTITPTWYEPSHNVSLSDNGGDLYVDLYAR